MAPAKLQGGAKVSAGDAALLKTKDGFDSRPARADAAPTKGIFHLPSIPKPTPDVLGEPPVVPPAALSQLSTDDLVRVQKVAAGASGATAQQNLRRLVESEGFKSSDVALQTTALRMFLADPTAKSSMRSLTSLLESANFRSLSAKDKAQVMDIFRATDTQGRENTRASRARAATAPCWTRTRTGTPC